MPDETARLGGRESVGTPCYGKQLSGCRMSPVRSSANLSPSCAADYVCAFFLPQSNSCRIYDRRPLDCQLYPLMLTYDKGYENVILVLDKKCLYVQRMGTVPTFEQLSGRDSPHFFRDLPHGFIMPYQPDTIKIATIKTLEGFKALALEHRQIFDKYLGKSEYSARSFVNIYIWSDLFNILWKEINNNLCVFYEYKNEFNMLLPSPVGLGLLKPGGRIENIAKEEIKKFKASGLKVYKNTDEYIYLAKDIAGLAGNRFASQRAAMNHFIKNNKFCWRHFEIDDIDECLNLYKRWMGQKKNKDGAYQQLMADSFTAHRKAMLNFKELGLTGRVVEINGAICAYTFAFKMNADTYCIILETADTGIKGLAQFIFSRFAQDLAKETRYINAMDDSGLENLKKAKLSWRPYKILTNYIAEA
jgi:hypothetical protein